MLKDVRNTLVLVSFFYLLFQDVSAQFPSELDSLKSILSQNISVEEEAFVLNKISWISFEEYNDSVLFYAEEALAFAETNQLIEQKLEAHLQLGEMFRAEHNWPKAIDHLAIAEALLTQNDFPAHETRLLLFQGNLAQSLGEIDAALSTYESGLKLSVRSNPKLHSTFCLKLGTLHKKSGKLEVAEPYFKEALDAALANGNNRDAIKASNNLGNYYARFQDYEIALKYYEQSLKLSTKFRNKKGESRAFLNIGNIHIIEGDWLKAIEYYVSSAEIKEELGDLAGIAIIHNNIGSIYHEQKRFEESIRYFKKSAGYYRSSQDSAKLAEVLLNMGVTRVSQGNPKDGIDLLKTSLQLLDTLTQAPIVLTAKLNIAIAHIELGEYELALNDLNEAELDALKSDDQFSLMFIWNLAGASYFFLEDYSNAIVNYQKSYALAQELELLKDQKKALFGLYEAAQEKGNYEVSLKWFEKYAVIKDSMFNIASREKLLELEEEYESKQKANEISNLTIEKKNILLENQLKSKQLNLSLLSIAIVVLLGVLITLYFVFRTRKQKAQMVYADALNKEQVNKLMSEQEIATLEAVFQTQQKERKKLSKDIHDTLGSYLATLKYQHESSEPTEKSALAKDKFDTTSNLIAQACEEVRSISHQMATGEGMDFSLLPALEQLVQRLRTTQQFELEFNHFGNEMDLSRDTELMLYKIAQELLSNILKHAHATLVTLQLNGDAEGVTLMIEDNGVGFDPNQKALHGIGLSNVLERVEHADGRLDINSGVNRGTTILIALPLHQNTLTDD
jgi:signal transduction histidine kinase